jgi:hypothetical protein
MSDTMFTPGPWECRKNCDIISRSTGDWIGEVTLFEALNGCIGMKQSRANARLIAAAPDMYEALEMAILEYGKPGGPWNVPSSPGTWIDKAKAAIVKARGEQ